MADTKIGIVGAAGRMGQMLVRAVTEAKGARLVAAVEQPGHDAIGKDAGMLAGLDPLEVEIGEDTDAVFETAGTVIDFTVPEATVEHAGIAAREGTTLVVGTTGLDGVQEKALRNAAGKVPIVYAPNMSLGVNLLFALTEQVARTLDTAYDIEVLEMHHKHKVDAPSGTALGLGRAAAAGRRTKLDDVAQMVREGHTGPRREGDIGFATLRGGDVVGEHSVIFATEGERIELTHKAGSRMIFARGAVRAALWAAGKKPGLYDMFDVLGLK